MHNISSRAIHHSKGKLNSTTPRLPREAFAWQVIQTKSVELHEVERLAK